MRVARPVFDVAYLAASKLSSRFRRLPQVSELEWSVISITRPLFYLIRIFGLAPFEISDQKFIAGSYDVLYSFCCTLVYTYVTSHVFPNYAFKRDTSLIEFLGAAKVIFNYCVTILNILMAVRMRKKFIRVLNILRYFDTTIHELGYPRNEGALKIWVWSTGICTAILWISANRTGMIAFDESWAYNMAFILNYFTNSLSTIKFSGVMLLLYQRFRILNKITRHGIESTKMKKHVTIDLKVVHQLHNSLMNAAEGLNSQYSWPLLFWLINLSVHSVSNLYFLIKWTLVSTPDWAIAQSWPKIHCTAWWFITFVLQLILINMACHCTAAEANSIGSIMINHKISAADERNTVDSSLHLINRRLNFSAAGCLDVNLTLLRSIAALFTTYLVLLFQFQGSR